MKELNKQLTPCPLCGGKGEYKHKKRKGHITLGVSMKASKEERYIRCSNCHARTISHGKIDNVINDWVLGLVYPQVIYPFGRVE